MDDNDPLGIPPELDRSNPSAWVYRGNAEDRPEPGDMSSSDVENGEAQRSEPESAGQPDLKPYPFAEMFPRMQGKDFDDLVTSIKEDGQEEPIVTYDGSILDGRNRYAACIEAKVEPKFNEYEGNDPLGYVLRKNLHRRQLQISQRAMVAAKMADLNIGQRADEVSGTSIDVAAKALSIGRASVDRAKSVLACGNVDLINAVECGEISVSAAAKQVNEPADPVEVIPEGERQCQKLQKLWSCTGDEGRELFRKAIEATT
jgi:hypothetical protein